MRHGADRRTRPPGVLTTGKKEAASSEEALRVYPIGIKVRREFADIHGRRKVFLGEVYDFSDLSW